MAQREHLGDLLVRLEREKVRDVLALGVAAALRQLVRLRPVHPPEVGEEQQPVVGGRHEEVVDDVVLAQLRTADALAATLLRPVVIRPRALDVAAAGDRDDHLLLGDEVLHGHVAVEREDVCPTLVAIAGDELLELFADDVALTLRRHEDLVEVRDLALELGILVRETLALHGSQRAQLEGEDRAGLELVDVEELHQAGACVLDGRGRADERDDLVEDVESLEVADDDVRPLLGLAQHVARSADNDLDLVRGPVADERVDRERARDGVDERDHVRAEGVLELRVLVEVVEHDLGDGVALEHDDKTLAGAARRLVAQVGDPLDLAVLDEVTDLGGEVVRVDLVGQLGDDQADAALDLLDVDDRTHRDRAAARAVGVFDALATEDGRAGREVRTLDDAQERLEKLLTGHVGVGEVPTDTLGHLAEVVRRDVRRHAHGDAGGPVDEEVREARRQDRRLLRTAVVVVLEVDGVLVDLADHLHRERRHAALGVPRRRGRVVSGRAEVALTGDERIPERPVLDEAHHGVIDGGVAVRVELAHDVTDDAGALGERAVRAVSAVEHRIEHAPVHGLEAVAHVGEGTRHDDAHRVVEERPLHLLVEVDLVDAPVVDAVDGARLERLRRGGVGSLVAHGPGSFARR